jgi:hypothetical protein
MLTLRRSFLTWCAVAACLVLAPASLPAQSQPDAAKLAGTWNMNSLTPDGDSVPWKLTLKLQDGKWGGSIASEQGENPISNVKVDGAKIHFTTPYQGEYYDQDLQLQDGKLVGTWSGNDNSGKTTGVRAGS